MSCKKPFLIKHKGIIYKIPCGWCMQCRIDRRNAWADRLLFECIGKRNTFLTMTYDDEHLPKNESLSKKDARHYLERLRIHLKRKYNFRDWKHYLVGEYGDSFGRPHYHAILTNIDSYKFADDLDEKWGMGHIKAEPAHNGAITYVLKYIEKQQHSDQAKILYDDNGIERPFQMISKGIGKQYMLDHMDEMTELGGYYYKGTIRPLCTYYKNLLRIGEKANNLGEKLKKATENGYAELEDYLKAVGYLKEKHIIQELRNKLIPVDETYLTNYLPTKLYEEAAKRLTEKIDISDNYEYNTIQSLFEWQGDKK